MIGQADFVYVAVKNIKTTGEKTQLCLISRSEPNYFRLFYNRSKEI